MSLLKLLFAGCLCFTTCTVVVAQNRVIELTVFAGPRGQAGAQQDWVRSLADVGADRVSSVVRAVDRPSIKEETFGGSTIVLVNGVLKRDRLLLPGKSFTRSDAAGIREYLQKLRDDSVDVAMAEKKAFGLTAEQLRQLHTMLSNEVTRKVIGKPAHEAVAIIGDDARLNLTMDTDVRSRLMGGKPLRDERKGLSVGTALASILAERGLVLVPRRPAGGSIQLHVLRQGQATEFWPVGWPSEKVPVELEPRLFQRQDIRIEGFPLGDALAAVANKCGATMLYDRASIESQGVELAKTEVSFSRKQVTYQVALGKLLRQSDPPLEIEIRVDEAGRPFAWIDVRD